MQRADIDPALAPAGGVLTNKVLSVAQDAGQATPAGQEAAKGASPRIGHERKPDELSIERAPLE
jgi:hypothetical protein